MALVARQAVQSNEPHPKGVDSTHPQKNVAKSNGPKYHTGIDISHYQGDFLTKVDSSDSVKWVVCKATEGVSVLDDKFQQNWKIARDKNLTKGAYHFYITTEDPIEQANFFCETIGNLAMEDLPPVLDLEQDGYYRKRSKEGLQRDILIWLIAVQNKTGKRPIIYTNYTFAQLYLKHSSFAEYPLWIAHYTDADKPLVPSAWKDKGWTFWQCSSEKRIKNTRVDWNRFKGSSQDFAAFIKDSNI